MEAHPVVIVRTAAEKTATADLKLMLDNVIFKACLFIDRLYGGNTSNGTLAGQNQQDPDYGMHRMNRYIRRLYHRI